MAEVSYVDGMQLWVWDTGKLEGFAVYLNGELITNQVIEGAKLDVVKPTGTATIVVQFSGVDGGATKLVDTVAKSALAFQDSGNTHTYTVTG